ncbi:MAG: hypothetical protein IJU20_01075 [Clostridia bacterium]|nr:hypothetical protein [Clostridia bacterium]
MEQIVELLQDIKDLLMGLSDSIDETNTKLETACGSIRQIDYNLNALNETLDAIALQGRSSGVEIEGIASALEKSAPAFEQLGASVETLDANLKDLPAIRSELEKISANTAVLEDLCDTADSIDTFCGEIEESIESLRDPGNRNDEEEE